MPTEPTLEHYRQILTGNLIPGVTFVDFFLNSALVAVSTVVLSGLVALLAATAVARFRFKLRTSFLIMLLVVQMIPLEALVIPLFLMIQRLGLYNTLPSLILTYLGFSLPFAVWMLRGFVAAVPKELEEAAAIDGASRAQIFRKVLFPLVAPGLVATSIFSFITAWNELIFALTFINDQEQLHPAGRDDLLLRPGRHRLGPGDGRVHPVHPAGDHLLPAGAATDGLRPGGRRRQGLTPRTARRAAWGLRADR